LAKINKLHAAMRLVHQSKISVAAVFVAGAMILLLKITGAVFICVIREDQ
jgi:hypothetical protein